MALNFSKASTQFVRNVVELGVCDNPACLNAYHAPAGCRSQSTSPSLLPPPQQARRSVRQSPTSGATAAAAPAAPSTRPVIAVDVAEWLQALDSDAFPLPEVCQQLSSSELQMSQSLERFVNELFSKASRRYAVQLETLVRALRLLELVQLTNIRAHQRLLQSQPSQRSTHSSASSSLTTTVAASAAHGGTWSQAPTMAPRDCSVRSPQEAVLQTTVPAVPMLYGPSPLRASAPMPVAPSKHYHLGQPFQYSSCSTSPALAPSQPPGSTGTSPGLFHRPLSVAQRSAFDESSASSGTIGPLTDTDHFSYDKQRGLALKPSSLTSWCLPTKSPCGILAGGSNSNDFAAAPRHPVDLPSLLHQLQLCPACEGSHVFALQYYNVHLVLAACLALSISINEVQLMESTTEDALTHQIAQLSQCTDLSLQMAMRIVCEVLEGQLCVFDSDVDVLVHRLNVVETCVFATEDL